MRWDRDGGRPGLACATELVARSILLTTALTLLSAPAAACPASTCQPLRPLAAAGHNGLVAACLLAQQGLSVEVFEEKPVIGGACRSEYPFAKVPGLGQSTGVRIFQIRSLGGEPACTTWQTGWCALRAHPLQPESVVILAARRPTAARPAAAGAYLLGVMPPELIKLLGLRIPLRRRDPHYFLPTTGARHGHSAPGAREARTARQSCPVAWHPLQYWDRGHFGDG